LRLKWPAKNGKRPSVVMDELYDSLVRLKTLSSVAILVLLFVAETAAPFFAARPGRERLRHAGRNLFLGVVNATLCGLAFTGLWLGAARESELLGFGLLYRWPAEPVARGICSILLLDLWAYAWHRWNHRNAFLWRFHRTHHSDPQMDVTTASRFHLGEITFSSLLRVPVIFLAGAQLHEVALYEILMFSVVQFHHSNLGLSARVERVLRWFVVTPGMHKVHHSRVRSELDSNYSSLLSIWDRLFRSFQSRADLEQIRFGLDDFDDEGRQDLPGLFATPAFQLGGRERNWFLLLWIPPVLAGGWLLSLLALWWLG
jgi:sterol desaturase/sphingolipid hydroxylase (fatty acid hydroxylase superfamily)